MLFAMPSVRTKLGLTQRPSYDPDIRAKRLIQADEYLGKVLYGREDLFWNVYGRGNVKDVSPTAPSKRPVSASKTAQKQEPRPGGGKDAAMAKLDALLKELGAGRAGDGGTTVSKTEAKPVPKPDTKPSPKPGTKPVPKPDTKPAATPPGQVAQYDHDDPTDRVKVLGTHGRTIYEIAGNEAASPHVIIVKTDGTFCRGSELSRAEASKLHVGTKVLLGYAVGGPVTASNGPIKICGAAWKMPTTYYLVQGTLVPGDKIDDRRIRAGTYIFYRQ